MPPQPELARLFGAVYTAALADVLETALAEAEAVAGTRNVVREAVRDGTMPLEAYERFGKL